MKKILLFVWQLPQNLLGLLVIFLSKAKKYCTFGTIYYTHKNFGVSLGNYIIINYNDSYLTIRHERGHQMQSLYLGWLYLFVIGIPSSLGNIYDRFFHKRWNNVKRNIWYYKQHWEKWADELGGVDRSYLEQV